MFCFSQDENEITQILEYSRKKKVPSTVSCEYSQNFRMLFIPYTNILDFFLRLLEIDETHIKTKTF